MSSRGSVPMRADVRNTASALPTSHPEVYATRFATVAPLGDEANPSRRGIPGRMSSVILHLGSHAGQGDQKRGHTARSLGLAVLNQVVEPASPTLIATSAKRIGTLAEDDAQLREHAASCGRRADLDTSF